jgi:hypothetical protein
MTDEPEAPEDWGHADCSVCEEARRLSSDQAPMLIPIRMKSGGQFDYPDDVRRIVAAFAARGYLIIDADAATAWERYSDDYYAAGWLSLGSADATDLFESLKQYFAFPPA